MPGLDKKSLNERDICTKFITPAVEQAGWDVLSQIREEVCFTKGRIIVRGKLVTRGKAKRADYILYYKPNIPIALIEAGLRRDIGFVDGDLHSEVAVTEHTSAMRSAFVFGSGSFTVFADCGGGGLLSEDADADEIPSGEDGGDGQDFNGKNDVFHKNRRFSS